MSEDIKIQLDEVKLAGQVNCPAHPKGWVLFAHGSGSSRKSPRNTQVAHVLLQRGFGTVLFDLLTIDEDQEFKNRFDIDLLADRLIQVTHWLLKHPDYNHTGIAYFGASTGAAAALVAASENVENIPLRAIVSRGGRPDLAGAKALVKVNVPTLLIVGSKDFEVIKLNEWAKTYLIESKLVLVPGATHLFEEKGAMDEVTRLAGDWFSLNFKDIPPKTPGGKSEARHPSMD